ncbi:hypothetical protein PAGA_a1573 [Pseudoalteromonas agarivorans DSM 14585]|uniref:Uncharacterized protein n=1 Tax=Pseudoalteromonas agarivorans DSM 14585 TaxID=1312369 RepID=A0ACA8DVP8_9GAMM|nr:hypothetical protein PAGA_a1573 [Pseudoalteromonas agarivorans DSM 14585]
MKHFIKTINNAAQYLGNKKLGVLGRALMVGRETLIIWQWVPVEYL